MKRFILFIILISLFHYPSMGQRKNKLDEKTSSITEVKKSKSNIPSIMVIPYVNQGEDLRNALEKDVNKRIVLNKIRESFDKAGFTTIDFVARLKAISNNSVFMEGSQMDIKNLVIQNSGADVYIEAEMVLMNNSAKIILTGYDTSTGASLTNAVGESGTFPGLNDYGKLGQTAIDNCQSSFIMTLKDKLEDIEKNGRSLMFNVSVDEGASITLESEVGSQGLQLSDEIELWVDEHAFNGSYHIQGSTSTLMIFDDIRIPTIDPQTNKTYNVNKFGLDFMKFMRGLNVSIQREIKGNTIYIKIK